MDMVDKTMSLEGDEDELEVQRLINIALLCIQNVAEQRPSMERVVAMLQGDSESEAVAPVKYEDEYSDSIRLLGVGNYRGLATVREEGESSSSMNSSRRLADRFEVELSTGVMLELSEIKVR